MEARDIDSAIAAFRQSASLRPDDADAYFNLGLMLGEKIRALVDEKVAAYQKAVELRPNQADAHRNLGAAYIQKAQLSRADEKEALITLATEQFKLYQQLAPQDAKTAGTEQLQTSEPQVK